MAAGFVHNEGPQVVQRKHIKQRTEDRCQMSEDGRQMSEDGGKRRLKAEGGMFKQRAEIGVHSRQLKAQSQ
jgi:hypothetical protein